jgi:predicted alpha/beta-fold hydrolase
MTRLARIGERDQFRPSWWLPGPHLPTLWAALASPKPPLASRRERLPLEDGDFLDLDWVGGASGPLIIVLHGLEGSINSSYARRILHRVDQQGWGGVLIHFRGCSGEPNRADRSYHSGETGDFRFVLSVLRSRYRGRKLMAVGYSLGGNVLLKFLGESSEQELPYAAAAVSVPFDLAAGANRLNRGFSKLYQQHLVRSLHKKIRRKFANRKHPFSFANLEQWSDFWSFDDHVTAPLHGFTDAKEYYAKSSCRQFLATIRTRTLIIHSRDDPFLTRDAIPRRNELSSTTTLQLTNSGGHVGFISGRLPFKPIYWLDDEIMHWFKENLGIDN